MAEATYLTFQDPNISYRHKAVLVGALLYFLSPIDAIPDFLPGGFADDLTVMLAAVVATGQIGKKHLKHCREKYNVDLNNHKKTKETKRASSPSPPSE